MSDHDNALVKWIDARLPVFTIFRRHYVDHMLPRRMNKSWSFIVSIMMALVMLSGFFLALHYVPHADMAFALYKDMLAGGEGAFWHKLHAHGASFFFVALYVHIYLGLLHRSYRKPFELVWICGVVVFLLMIVTALTGETLSYDQDGGWAGVVSANMLTAIPVIGDDLTRAVLAGNTVTTATLAQFYVLHIVLPFAALLFVFLHIWSLRAGLGQKDKPAKHAENPDMVPFHPYHTYKGLIWTGAFLIFYAAAVIIIPAGPENPEKFNPLEMPDYVGSAWYLVPFYGLLRAVNFGVNAYIAIALVLFFFALRFLYFREDAKGMKARIFGVAGIAFFLLGYVSQFYAYGAFPLSGFMLIPAKTLGLLMFVFMFVLLLALPWLDPSSRKNKFAEHIRRPCLAGVAVSLALLGVCGSIPVSPVSIAVGQAGLGYLFVWGLVLLPWLSGRRPSEKRTK